MPDAVKIPGKAIDNSGDDLASPLKALLTDINALGASSDSAGGAFTKPAQSVAIIESGATALTKWWSGAVGALGGATAITAAITKFWNGQHGGERIALIASTGAVVVAVAIALAVIISSDVRGRAIGASAVYAARAQIATTFIEASLAASAAQAPVAKAAVPVPGAEPPEVAAITKQAASEALQPLVAPVVAAVAPLGGQLTALGAQVNALEGQVGGMDKRTALIVLGAIGKVPGVAKTTVDDSASGTTGAINDVFLGPSQRSESDVQINVFDATSNSLKAMLPDDVTKFS
ncbi:MAG: hypothetical protein ACLQRH_15170 [Acidimicrobiales bacterium]